MLELDKENCTAEVLEETAMPVAVDFWAPTCPDCMALLPAYEQFAKQYGSKIKFTKLDCSKKRSTAMKFRVMSMPAFLFYKNGKEIKRLGRGIKAEEIEAAIKELL
ncbi:MAG: thioredoxin family protein [Synergistaceae bacterium]|nr:thioredoxin family protein [Synergistaceae bacterium]